MFTRWWLIPPVPVALTPRRWDIATESRVASSREVAQNAAKSLIANGDTLSEAQLTSRLMNSVKVTGTSQTAVLDIEVHPPQRHGCGTLR